MITIFAKANGSIYFAMTNVLSQFGNIPITAVTIGSLFPSLSSVLNHGGQHGVPSLYRHAEEFLSVLVVKGQRHSPRHRHEKSL